MSDRVKYIALTSVASTTFSSTYQAINTSGFPHAMLNIKIVNNSDQDATISFDGTTDNLFVPKATTYEWHNYLSGAHTKDQFKFPLGTKVYVKGTAGMTGSIYLMGYYD